MNQQKNNQIRRLQAEVEELQNGATVSKIDRLELKSNPVSENEVVQLKTRIRTLEHKIQES